MEIEIKLALSDSAIASFREKIAEINVINTEKFQLINRYFDTSDNYFAQHKMGLRVREQDGRYTMTLKTAGKENNGLHARPEYNIAIKSAEPELIKFTELSQHENELGQIDWQKLNATIQPLFNTDFHREIWLVELKSGTRFEIALDQGYVIGGQQKDKIQELEFELVKGSVVEMLSFIMKECSMNGAYLASDSKAKRGYRLAGLAKDNVQADIVICKKTLHNLETKQKLSLDEMMSSILLLEDKLAPFIYSYNTVTEQQYLPYIRQTIDIYAGLFSYYQTQNFTSILKNQHIDIETHQIKSFLATVSLLLEGLKTISGELEKSGKADLVQQGIDAMQKIKERFTSADNLFRGVVLLNLSIIDIE